MSDRTDTLPDQLSTESPPSDNNKRITYTKKTQVGGIKNQPTEGVSQNEESQDGVSQDKANTQDAQSTLIPEIPSGQTDPQVTNNQVEGNTSPEIPTDATNDYINQNKPRGEDRPLVFENNSVNYTPPSGWITSTIEIGIKLYHATFTVDRFSNPALQLGSEDELCAFFTPNLELAKTYIQDCSLFPNKKGYIHVFEVIKPIDKILMIDSKDKDFTLVAEEVDDKFCKRKRDPKLNGIGFQYKNTFSKPNNTNTPPDYNTQFVLCEPDYDHLRYIETFRCVDVGTYDKPPV